MTRRRQRRQAGTTSVQMLAILVPVLFAFFGFAVDVGRLYLIRGELQTTVDAMAMAAATRLAGTEASREKAIEQAHLMATDGNRFDFGSRAVGSKDGIVSSEITEPGFYSTVSSARAGDGSQVTGAGARHVRVGIRAEAPLMFFGFLSLGQQRRTTVEVSATAGISAPLCTACNIEPIAIAALDLSDVTNFGLIPGTRYTLGFYCNGGLQPGPLNQGGQRIQYLMLNRYNESTSLFSDELSQSFRIGALGLPVSDNEGMACLTIGSDENAWVNAAPVACMLNRVPAVVNSFVCGIANRFDSTVPVSCNAIPEVESIATLSDPDTDIADLDDYPAYAGNGRRVITIPVVEVLNPGAPMRVLGFRQFFVEPHPDQTTVDASDPNARFMAIYIGSPVPVRQGRFDSCSVTSGPGKAVLHQ